MKHTNKHSRRGIYLAAIAAVLVVLGVVSGILTLNKDSNADVSTFVLHGKVTEKDTSCGKETLQSDGTIEHGAGICDGGNSITVNSLHISTGGGGLTSEPPKYVSDITSVHAGDTVEVRYAKDASGQPNTDCGSCYVKKVN